MYKIIPKIKESCLRLVLAALLMSSCTSSSQSTLQQADAAYKESDFVSIFDGKTLKGWDGDTTYWEVKNGSIVGKVTPATPLEHNTFLIWKGGQLANFELKGEFRISSEGNSGINYRSVALENIPFALKGYQADIDGKNNYTGQNYEERGRTTLAYRGQQVMVEAPGNPTEALNNYIKNNAWTNTTITEVLGKSDSLQALIKTEGWNEIHLVVKGNRLQHYINGTLMSDVTDNDTINRKLSGLLGLQVHVGPPMTVEYRNLLLKQL